MVNQPDNNQNSALPILQNTKITKLVLENFRNFATKKVDFGDAPIVFLCGENGVGKTNILEAITLLGRNSPLRGSDFEEMILANFQNNQQAEQFSIYGEISDHDSIEKIGIAFEKIRKKKNIQINGEILSGKGFSGHKEDLINFIWLTPQLELLLISGKGERRDYLDKIVADIDSKHLERINLYQKSLKERLLILQKYRGQSQANKWLEIVENKIVELGVSIAFARLDAIDFFNKAINSFESNFPKTKLKVSGDIEKIAYEKSAIQIEEFYLEKLQQNRLADLENFKTNFGVHRSDFSAVFLDKNAPSSNSSTGEQKSIMIGITLARAKISATYKNQPTILIFDEIMSHLDEVKKANLLAEIAQSGLQCFFSATTKNLLPQNFVQNNLLQIVELTNSTKI